MNNLISKDNLKLAPNLETIVCLSICLILMIVFIIAGCKARYADYRKSPKGLLFFFDFVIEKLDSFVSETMGPGFPEFGGLLLGISFFLFFNFIIGLTGLPTPMTYLPVPLSLGLFTFLMIHITAIKENKLKYFKRFIDPFPIFLPANLLSMWAPLLSLTLRMFGNAVVGWVLVSLINWGLENASAMIFMTSVGGPSDLFLVPIVTPILHAYFDVFSTCIQTLVFIFLTALFVAQEKSEPEEDLTLSSRKEVIVHD